MTSTSRECREEPTDRAQGEVELAVAGIERRLEAYARTPLLPFVGLVLGFCAFACGLVAYKLHDARRVGWRVLAYIVLEPVTLASTVGLIFVVAPHSHVGRLFARLLWKARIALRILAIIVVGGTLLILLACGFQLLWLQFSA